MVSHTKGDWGIATIDGGAGDDEIVTEVNGCTVNIAAVFGAGKYSEARQNGEPEPNYEVSMEEAAANARLIAAAPKMLAALELALVFCGKHQLSDKHFQQAVSDAIVDAIAEATVHIYRTDTHQLLGYRHD